MAVGYNKGAAGNIANNVAITTGATSSDIPIDISTLVEKEIIVKIVVGASVPTGDVDVNLYRGVGDTPEYDDTKDPTYSMTIVLGGTGGVTKRKTVPQLPTGQWKMVIVNHDTQTNHYTVTADDLTTF